MRSVYIFILIHEQYLYNIPTFHFVINFIINLLYNYVPQCVFHIKPVVAVLVQLSATKKFQLVYTYTGLKMLHFQPGLGLPTLHLHVGG